MGTDSLLQPQVAIRGTADPEVTAWQKPFGCLLGRRDHRVTNLSIQTLADTGNGRNLFSLQLRKHPLAAAPRKH